MSICGEVDHSSVCRARFLIYILIVVIGWHWAGSARADVIYTYPPDHPNQTDYRGAVCSSPLRSRRVHNRRFKGASGMIPEGFLKNWSGTLERWNWRNSKKKVVLRSSDGVPLELPLDPPPRNHLWNAYCEPA
jgi:hypothetical protein